MVISGKGGTGKTSLMAAFASLAENKFLCDADVDAADLHLLMDSDIKESHDFQGGGTAVIHTDRCIECGLCRDLCRWNAISEAFIVDPIECEGCGVCVDFVRRGHRLSHKNLRGVVYLEYPFWSNGPCQIGYC